jgi:glycosyltransferase involved in cell wall biosynthesis
MKLLSIIIPVFNEEKTILELLSRVIKADTMGLKKEIIVVDDGSTDTTVQKLKKLSKETKHGIQVICKPKNYGKGAAVRTGILTSRGDVVIIQDADLEYSPTDYPKLLSPIISGDADIVYGSRFKGEGAHRVLYFWHFVMNNMLTTLSNMLTNVNLTDMECCYKVFRGSLIRDIAPKLQSNRFGFEP